MSKKKLLNTYFHDFTEMTTDYAEQLFQRSRGYYQEQLDKFDKYYNRYHSPGTNGEYDKNMVFELIETEVDNNIYYPQVRSMNGKIEAASELEQILKNELFTHKYREFNDQQERNTYIFGGAITLVYWDRLSRQGQKGGKLEYKIIDPRYFIPQHGINRIEDMDYCFIVESATKLSIENLYNLNATDINFASSDAYYNIDPDLITVKTMYYKDKYNHICRFSWSGQLVLENDENIYLDKRFVCSKCGKPKLADEDECISCGNKEFKLEEVDRTKIKFEVDGEEIEHEITPYYPNRFPIIIRQNISSDKLFGVSDVEMIETSQVLNNRVMNKLTDRILKSGSIVLLPKELRNKVTLDNSELKIVWTENPEQASRIQAINLQPAMGNETVLLDMSYATARQTLGITNTYQGREDNSAISSKAKEIQVQQTAGRLESKREMKKASLINLFEMMFEFILAYSDEYRGYYIDKDGEIEYKVYDNRLFINKDSDDNWYYDDDYLFDIDLSATYEMNRQKMWEDARQNLASGAYGNPEDIGAIKMFWKTMYKLHYPGAKEALEYAGLREQQLMLQQQMDRLMQERQLQIQASAQRSQDMVNEQNTKTARNESNAKMLEALNKKK